MSTTVSDADFRAAFAAAGQWHAARTREEFAAVATATLHELIPADGVGWNEVDVAGRALRILTSPHEYAAPFEHLGNLIAENPIVEYVTRTGDHSPTTFSDHVSVRQYRRLEVYAEIYGPAGVEDQLATVTEIHPHIVGIAFNRRHRSFSQRDRDLLTLVRPHLGTAYRNLMTRLDAAERLGLLERGIAGRHVVPLAADGTLAARSPLVSRWFGETARVDPGVYERDDARLVVRLVHGDPPVLLLDEERLALDPERVREFGLTTREAQVVLLGARGFTSAQVAAELFVSTRTVAKHLEHAYRKLGVHSRAEAVAKLRG